MSERLLVTVLGRDPRQLTYSLGESTAAAGLAPIALMQMLPDKGRPTKVLALCTKEAEDSSWPALKKYCTANGVGASVVQLGGEPSDLPGFLGSLAAAIPVEPPPEWLMIDVTHGFRHYSFLSYAAIQYLATLRGLPIEGAYYGLVDAETGRFIDLKPLLDLPEWIYALRVFGDAGDASGLARLVERAGGQVGPAIAKALREISEMREAGLPLELGHTSTRFLERRKPFAREVKAQGALLPDELWKKLEEPLRRFGLPHGDGVDLDAQSGWKTRIALDRSELDREGRLIDDLLEHGNLPAAFGLMNEWTVSRVVLQLRPGEESWLDYEQVRRAAASKLGALAALRHESALNVNASAQQQELADFWATLSELRNAFHHHGMRRQALGGVGADVERKVERVKRYWDELKNCADLPLERTSSGRRLLVSPVGLRQGVLYSAIHACRGDGVPADAALVLVSSETSGAAEDALREAAFNGQTTRLAIADPHGGKEEIERLVKEARVHLASAEEVAVNLTGGTTLMGLVVARIADEARKLGREVRRFGLIDRRPPKMQEDEPYVASEAFWLDPRSNHAE